MSTILTRPATESHGALMDSIYRRQRHIYDATRKYYLFGRDTLIDRMGCAPGQSVLEVGCGTGRNLARIGSRWPWVRLHGFDISAQMLETAEARLGTDARLALGDATGFDPAALFGIGQFDHVMISFALSMIPDWRVATDRAARVLAPGGKLHIVDFGDLGGLPRPLRALLNGWLSRFHVTPRLDLVQAAETVAQARGLTVRTRRGPLGYYRIVTLRRPDTD